MTGPISEAATGPRESAAAAPAKEGLHPGLGNPGAGLLVDEGPRAAPLILVTETGGKVTRDRRK